MVKICSRCILDSDIIGIRFDEQGVCNFCKIHDQWEQRYPTGEYGQQKIIELFNRIKSNGEGKKYDCLVGISGGVDSSYVVYLLKNYDLNPLAVHLDNGWNSRIAEQNMKNLVSRLNVDLKIINPNWDEFKDLQISFLKASVPDMEIPTDIAYKSILFRLANDLDLKYIVTGGNFRTEGKTPISWTYMDARYIKNVQEKYGTMKLSTFPNLSFKNRFYYTNIKKMKIVRPLNYIDYNKKEILTILKEQLGWCPYGGKHYESTYTRFVQSFMLPKKFNIDKRKVHYSALIRSGQINRVEALNKIRNEPPYPDKEIQNDKNFILHNFGMSEQEFDEIYTQPIRSFLDFKTSYSVIKKFKIPLKIMYRLISDSPPTIFEEMKYFEEDRKKNLRRE